MHAECRVQSADATDEQNASDDGIPDARVVSYLSVVRGRSQELSAHPVDLPVVLGDAHFADGPILHPRSAGRGVGGERRARGGRAGGAPAHTRERASRLPKHSGSFACACACAEGAPTQKSPYEVTMLTRDILTHIPEVLTVRGFA